MTQVNREWVTLLMTGALVTRGLIARLTATAAGNETMATKHWMLMSEYSEGFFFCLDCLLDYLHCSQQQL